MSPRSFASGCLACAAAWLLLARCDLPPRDWLVPLVSARASAPRQAPDAPTRAGPVSIGFAQDMSMHHDQALVMAGMALQRGTPPVQAFARGIASAQLRELGYLQGWLLLWDAPAASGSGTMDWMRDAYWKSRQHDEGFEVFINACTGSGSMPGLATVAQLDQLAKLHGPAFDRLFLQLMARHHQGAVVMAQFAWQYAELEAVRGFALSMAAEQRKEWMLMSALLQAGG